MDNIVSAEVKKFSAWYAKHGDDPQALGYGASKSQEVRFSQFTKFCEFSGNSLVDLGCGFGDLLGFLVKNNIKPKSYTGVEPVSEFFEVCRSRYLPLENVPCNFHNTDALNWLKEKSSTRVEFDWLIACGIFNSQLHWEDRDRDVKRILKTMWSLCRNGIGFNMENSDTIENHSINNVPAFWLDYVSKNLSPKLIFTSDYHDQDFTIIVLK